MRDYVTFSIHVRRSLRIPPASPEINASRTAAQGKAAAEAAFDPIFVREGHLRNEPAAVEF